MCLVERIEEIKLSGVSHEMLRSRAEEMVRAGSGIRFDPKVVDAYLAVVNDLDALKAV